MFALAKRLLELARIFCLQAESCLGGVIEMSLAAFVSFFFYRDGVALVRFLNVAMDRIGRNPCGEYPRHHQQHRAECHVRAIGNRSGAGFRGHNWFRHRRCLKRCCSA